MEIKRARAFVHGISAVAVHTTPRAAREASRLLIALRPTHEARARAAMAIIDLLQPKGEDAMPPGVMLSAHIVAKGVEFGAVIGLAIGLVACLPVTGGRFKVRFRFARRPARNATQHNAAAYTAERARRCGG